MQCPLISEKATPPASAFENREPTFNDEVRRAGAADAGPPREMQRGFRFIPSATIRPCSCGCPLSSESEFRYMDAAVPRPSQRVARGRRLPFRKILRSPQADVSDCVRSTLAHQIRQPRRYLLAFVTLASIQIALRRLEATVNKHIPRDERSMEHR